MRDALLHTTALPNWPRLTLTPIERAAGRFMRAPDHDGAADGAGGGDAAVGADQSDGGAGEGDGGSGSDEGTVLGSAAAVDGAGDEGEKGEGDDQSGDDDKGKTDGEAEGPPETYDLKVTVKAEDGKDTEVPIDAELLAKATPVLKDLGLTNEQANKVASLVPEIQGRIVQQQADSFTAMKADWAKEAKADKEIGGAKWAETEALCAKALDTLGFPKGSAFRQLLDDTGMGNNPDMIRAWRKVGLAIGEGDFVLGDGSAIQKKDRVREMYPNDPPKEVTK